MRFTPDYSMFRSAASNFDSEVRYARESYVKLHLYSSYRFATLLFTGERTEAMEQAELDKIWRELLAAARLQLYYQRLSERLNSKNRGSLTVVLAMAILAALSGPVGYIVVSPADGLTLTTGGLILGGLVLSVLTIIGAVWLSHSDYSRKAGLSAAISAQHAELVNHWEHLWIHMHDADAPTRFGLLEARTVMVQATLSQQDLEEDMKLSATCEDDADRLWTLALRAGHVGT